MKSFYTAKAVLSIPLLLCLSSVASSQTNSDLKQTLSFASYYSSGDYGSGSDTDILYFPISYSLAHGKWRAELTVPHLRVEGVGNVLVNVGGVNRAVAGTLRETHSGVGDSTLAFIYQMDPLSDSSPYIDLRLDIKIPTADRYKGLGTGEADYSAQIDLSQNLGNSVVFASAGYTWRGTTSFYPGLEDSTSAQLGVARPLNSEWNIGIFYDFREPASTLSPEIHELVPYFSWQITPSWSFTGLTAFGFTDASARTAVLGQISYRW